MAIWMSAPAYRAYALERARGADSVDPGGAWHHLERAHILAQPFVIAHVGSHIAMLRLALQTRDRTEVCGQLVRIVLAGPASLVGRVPVGNTGRARTPLNATRPVPDDLAAVLAQATPRR